MRFWEFFFSFWRSQTNTFTGKLKIFWKVKINTYYNVKNVDFYLDTGLTQ